nr:MAG TPA: hypothetical protein [Caudoviricetes sp.]
MSNVRSSLTWRMFIPPYRFYGVEGHKLGYALG